MIYMVITYYINYKYNLVWGRKVFWIFFPWTWEWRNRESSKDIAILFELQALKYQKDCSCMWSQDVCEDNTHSHWQTHSSSLSLDDGHVAALQMIKTCKKCWKVKDPGALCFENVWAGRLRAPWLNISHEPECNSDHSSAAVRLDGGGRGDAGEWLPNTRGSSSLGEMEGLRKRRGEHSLKALWRLAAVGRAAVFPKSPPNRKTVSFFSVAQEQPLP